MNTDDNEVVILTLNEVKGKNLGVKVEMFRFTQHDIICENLRNLRIKIKK